MSMYWMWCILTLSMKNVHNSNREIHRHCVISMNDIYWEKFHLTLFMLRHWCLSLFGSIRYLAAVTKNLPYKTLNELFFSGFSHAWYVFGRKQYFLVAYNFELMRRQRLYSQWAWMWVRHVVSTLVVWSNYARCPLCVLF